MSHRLAVRWPHANRCEYSSSVCAFGALLLAASSLVSSCTASRASFRFFVATVSLPRSLAIAPSPSASSFLRRSAWREQLQP
eukprot:3209893-Pleurochrysis_carterae.AAC.2